MLTNVKFSLHNLDSTDSLIHLSFSIDELAQFTVETTVAELDVYASHFEAAVLRLTMR